MIEGFAICTFGGRVLFSFGTNLLDSGIHHTLQGTTALGPIKTNTRTDAVHELFYIAGHDALIPLDYLDELLDCVQAEFHTFVSTHPQMDTGDFEGRFNDILDSVESAFASAKPKGPRKFEETTKFANTLKGSKLTLAQREESQVQSKADMTSKIEELIKKKTRKSKTPNDKTKNDSNDKTSKKVMRSWGSDGMALGKNDQKLDFSNSSSKENADATHLFNDVGVTKNGVYDAPEMEDDEEEVKESSGIFSYFSKFTLGKTLTESDLITLMEKLKEQLINKNVAANIASHLTQSISQGLQGKTISRFESIDKLVREQTNVAVSRILTPSSSSDLLLDILDSKKSSNDPYTICFIGVNGVGKSTNLSKICFWLLQNKLKVLIAACDTFRAGAVEQLRVHARNLSLFDTQSTVELFDKGYGKDPAGIAKDAVAYAKAKGFDVVLIDTAGRMQDNEPLMRALSKLVAVNNPNKILFVGEALVGNEAVDQLNKFNQALKDFSGMASPRVIDGMLLTKFDTIDDKVGACLSMTFVTGKPILFLGTGQTYTDLRKLNVKRVVKLLLE